MPTWTLQSWNVRRDHWPAFMLRIKSSWGTFRRSACARHACACCPLTHIANGLRLGDLINQALCRPDDGQNLVWADGTQLERSLVDAGNLDHELCADQRQAVSLTKHLLPALTRFSCGTRSPCCRHSSRALGARRGIRRLCSWINVARLHQPARPQSSVTMEMHMLMRSAAAVASSCADARSRLIICIWLTSRLMAAATREGEYKQMAIHVWSRSARTVSNEGVSRALEK